MDAHPLADLVPLMTAAEFEALRADVAANGLAVPIVLYEGRILDGRHRYRACVEAGVEPRYTTLSTGDPVAFVFTHNIARRQLSKSQLAMAAAKLKGYYAEQAKERMRAGGGDKKSKKSGMESLPYPIDRGAARDQAAARFGLSGKVVDDAERVVKKGTLELRAAVECGGLSVNQAAKIAELPKERQRLIVAIPDARARTAAIQRSINISKGSKSARREALAATDSSVPGTELVRSLLSRLEVITNDIERRGITAEQFAEQFLREMQWSEPLLVARIAYVSTTIRALATLSMAAEKAKREAA